MQQVLHLPADSRMMGGHEDATQKPETSQMAEFKTHNSLAKPQNCALLVIDVQEKLINSIAKAEEVIANIAALIKIARLFQIPIVVTEQEKLGPTVAVLKELLEQDER